MIGPCKPEVYDRRSQVVELALSLPISEYPLRSVDIPWLISDSEKDFHNTASEMLSCVASSFKSLLKKPKHEVLLRIIA